MFSHNTHPPQQTIKSTPSTTILIKGAKEALAGQEKTGADALTLATRSPVADPDLDLALEIEVHPKVRIPTVSH